MYRAAGLYDCPELCSDAGASPLNWTQFNSNNDLKWCKDQTMVLSLPLYMPLSDPNTHSVFRACVSSASEGEVQSRVHQARKRAETEDDGSVKETEEIKVVLSSATSSLKNFTSDVGTALRQLQDTYFNIPQTDNTSAPFFAKRGDAVVGAYVGSRVQKQGAAASLLERLSEMIAAAGAESLPQTTVLQVCGDERNSEYTVGVVIDGRGGLDSVFAVQEFVRTWAQSECITSVDGDVKTESMSIAYTDGVALPSNIQNDTLSALTSSSSASHLDQRDDCRTIQVHSGDGCGTLATKCGISSADFTKLHESDKNFCSTLKEGQWVCCTSGTLPDIRPKPEADGSCHKYVVIQDDYCDKIAAANGLTSDDLEDLNQNTWGWSGCKSLWVGMYMCLSKGDPPMPAPLENARCGPQVPGTEKPNNDTKLADLNPCPLNVCCNVWGQCGTTEDFCIESSLGPPGTSEPGKNGCISSCGMDIINNDVGPASSITLGYFEAWNNNRECLHMDVTQMSKRITHVHFAFADVTPSFTVQINPQVKDQFNKFKAMTGHHKVVAFGGWSASTFPTSYWIFREGVKDANREMLATNLANFIIANDLDGIDIDWEYPGAQDLPDIPAADTLDGERYLALIRSLRKKLPRDKTMSIAAPASFWYLQNFPIQPMSEILDYVVFMTYDLHGQWDWDSKWSMPGCDGTSCLRSHVNMSETLNSLSMITKAGVQSNKVVVGVSSYGRSFQMTEPGCTGPMCGFTGPESGAKKGRCTAESGYISNAEIDEIIKTGSTGGKRDGAIQMFTDDSNSQILVYDDIHWVAYMDDNEKDSRAAKWKGLNMAGTTDWAVDLATFTPGDDNPNCYISKNCKSEGATTTSTAPSWRWYKLCTDTAWKAAMEHWDSVKNSGQSFPRAVSDFFHGPSAFDCHILSSQNSCKHIESCIQGDDTGPAGWLILDSWAAIHEVKLSAHNTLQTTAVLQDFVKTFCPDKKPDLALKIILDIVSFGLSFATGPIFNNCEFSSELLNYDAQTIANRAASPGPEPGKEGDTSKQILAIVRRFKEDLNSTLPAIFGGSPEGIDTLWNLINDGKLLTAEPVPDLNMEDKLLKIMYALLVPIMWREKGWRPVLMDLETDCGKKVERLSIIPKSDDTLVCFEGRQYMMVRPEGKAFERYSASANHWGLIDHWNQAEPMAGFKTLDGTNWAGLKKEDIVASIINRRKKGPNPSEAGTLPDLGDKNLVDDMYQYVENDNIVQSPGYIDIPVCSVKEVRDNWQNKKDEWFAWPCNKP
ncbi:glycoside hydrolase [Thozetella sp. PMI_491]|nr:glycoside hydrolase [Thozetella sp. PMI_491]